MTVQLEYLRDVCAKALLKAGKPTFSLDAECIFDDGRTGIRCQVSAGREPCQQKSWTPTLEFLLEGASYTPGSCMSWTAAQHYSLCPWQRQLVVD